MSGNILYVRLFNKVSEDTFRMLPALAEQHTSFTNLRAINESEPLTLFKTYIVDEDVKTYIQSRDVTLFTTHVFASVPQDTFAWAVVLNVIKESWQSLTVETKRIVWNNLQQLILISDLVLV
jgi:hypothetical protein